MAWPVASSRYYALPAEPPVGCVPVGAADMDGAERVDRLVYGFIEDMRAKAEEAREGILGGRSGIKDSEPR